MTKEQFEALIRYINAVAKLHVDNALGRDCLHESIERSEAESALKKLLIIEE